MKEDKHETLRKLCAFQYWLGSNYNNLPTNSGEMTKRARLYYETIEPAYCECEHPIVANDLPDGKPYCRNCGFNINPDKTKDFCDEDMPIMDYPYDSYSDRINACIDEYRDFIKAQYDEFLSKEKADEDSKEISRAFIKSHDSLNLHPLIWEMGECGSIVFTTDYSYDYNERRKPKKSAIDMIKNIKD